MPSGSRDYGSTHVCHLYFTPPHFHGFKLFTQYIVYMHSSPVIDCISTSKLVALTFVLQLTCTHAQFPSCLHHRYLWFLPLKSLFSMPEKMIFPQSCRPLFAITFIQFFSPLLAPTHSWYGCKSFSSSMPSRKRIY